MDRQQRDYIRYVYAQYAERTPAESDADRRDAVARHLRDFSLVTIGKARELVAAALPKRRRRNPAKLDRCVRRIKARNRRARRAHRKVARKPYAVCTAAMQKGKRRRRRRGNPAGWYIHVQRMGIGPVLLYNGRSFSNVDKPLAFVSARAAKQRARYLLRKFHKQLRYYKIWVADSVTSVAEATGTHRRINPDPLDEAARKLEDFTGRQATHVERGRARSRENTGLVIGELDLIRYRAKREGVRGGRRTRYAHEFRSGSRPLLAVSTDGKQLHIVGGRYEFTEAGIEDR